MAHGAYARRHVEGRRPLPRRQKGGGGGGAAGLGVDKKRKKMKPVSLKNQIRSTERLLKKNLSPELREAQEKKLEGLKRQHEIQSRLATERAIQLRDRKIKFFERRKVERMIRRLEKQQRSMNEHVPDARISEQLMKLREDLEYIRFFPKNKKYVSLFAGGDNPEIIEKRNQWRKQIKDSLIAAAESGKDLEETGSDDDALEISDDDFFMSGSSSDEAEADDEWTDKSTREPVSSASGKAASGVSSDEKNQVQKKSARGLMPPPRSLPLSQRLVEKLEFSTSSNTSTSMSGPSQVRRPENGHVDLSSNLSSNSDAQKPRRKRKHRKKKKQV